MQYIPKIPGLERIRGVKLEVTKDIVPQLLEADTAGHEIRKIYEKSHLALAGLLPVAFLSGEGSIMTRLCDLAIGVALPFHAHVGMNGIVSDYIPYAYRMPVRYGLLGATGIATLGLLKLNIFGPGITDTVRSLWKYEKPPPPPPPLPKEKKGK